mmetsp:Transcript_468/g.1916  ORF Transcript_468/g.1916 Transcript_468/m.1916 type:complete len:142 (+) Transcript_468:1908-2333(+)
MSKPMKPKTKALAYEGKTHSASYAHAWEERKRLTRGSMKRGWTSKRSSAQTNVYTCLRNNDARRAASSLKSVISSGGAPLWLWVSPSARAIMESELLRRRRRARSKCSSRMSSIADFHSGYTSRPALKAMIKSGWCFNLLF